MTDKIAVVLFNLGGPDREEAIEPFLFNLFSDPAIISVPQPVRWVLAKLIARRRAPAARAIYRELGGGSPLLGNTRVQAEALRGRLTEKLGAEVCCLPVMRYWDPRADEVAAALAAWKPARVVLLPLYPQFSTTTSGSSMRDWANAARSAGLGDNMVSVCCYPDEAGFIAALAGRTRTAIAEARAGAAADVRVLFSAHGLPQKIVAAGDPYQWQVERTARAVAAELDMPGLDWKVVYQSRVGPLEWLRPYAEDEIRHAGAEGKALVVVPLVFVSEHSETLVELDIEYRELAASAGVPCYVRTPTVSADAAFIDGLADLVLAALGRGEGTASMSGSRICPAECGRCAMAA